MAFTLNPHRTFAITVTCLVLQPSGAKKEESFKAEFEHLSGDEERAELAALKNVELLRRKMVGWVMKDDDKNDVPFTPENLEAFLKLVGPCREAAIAFWNGATGAREKN